MGRETDVDDTYFSEDKIMSMLDRGHESGEIDEEGMKTAIYTFVRYALQYNQ